jgi:hypothetical protein
MKAKIKVFIEGKPPVDFDITKETKPSDIMKALKVDEKKISVVYLSDKDDRPSTHISLNETIIKENETYWPKRKTEYKLRGKVLWVGFYPKRGESKYSYNWIGNKKEAILESKLMAEFGKRARYLERTGGYEIQGIQAKDTAELLQLYVQVRNYEVVKD